jgi:hypothetical protein
MATLQGRLDVLADAYASFPYETRPPPSGPDIIADVKTAFGLIGAEAVVNSDLHYG